MNMKKQTCFNFPLGKNKIKKLISLPISLILLVTIIHLTSAFPIPPSQFYGDVFIEGRYAPIGTNISAYDGEGILCGSFSIEEKGEYVISCKGDNLKTTKDEGAKENELITFSVNGKKIEKTAEWHQGGFYKLDLFVTKTNKTVEDKTTTLQAPPKKRIPWDVYSIISLFSFIIILVIIKIKKQDTMG